MVTLGSRTTDINTGMRSDRLRNRSVRVWKVESSALPFLGVAGIQVYLAVFFSTRVTTP